ncbi:hypothetical protein [Kitasatospora viridis]|nr:hypothetical protein [Kitasatospora viridis]
MWQQHPEQFESHITVDCAADRLDRLAQWSADRGLEFLHIVLARGRMTSQPMVTLTGTGTLAEHRAAVAAAAEALRADGFRPVRVKVEAAPWASGVPGSDAEAAALPADTYFEHHVKVRLRPGQSRDRLAERVRGHGAHVSWNARRADGPDGEQRFVTQRCHGVGLATAGERLAALLGALADGFDVRSVEREFVLHDSNTSVDDGWLDVQPELEGAR